MVSCLCTLVEHSRRHASVVSFSDMFFFSMPTFTGSLITKVVHDSLLPMHTYLANSHYVFHVFRPGCIGCLLLFFFLYCNPGLEILHKCFFLFFHYGHVVDSVQCENLRFTGLQVL